MAIAMLKHTPVGKSTQAQPYTAAAHARYIMRRSAANRVFSERMPLNWHAIQRFMKQHEDALRKNGRVADKLIISVPPEFSMAQAEAVLRKFGNDISRGKAPYLVSFHWGDHNPHAHIIFIDRDLETGKRVFGTSEKGSTELLKFVWAETVNDQFKELGLETRIQFGTRTEELHAANDEVSEPSPTVAAEEPEVVSEQPLAEEPQVPVIEQEGANRYQQAHSAAEELRRIRHLQNELRAVRERYEGAERRNRDATERAQAAVSRLNQSKLQAEQARETYVQEHRGMFGKKGFQVSAFGLSYTSPARKAADAAEQEYNTAKVQATLSEKTVADERANLELAQTDFDFYKGQFEQVQGNEAEIAEAELLYEATFNAYAGDLTPDDMAELIHTGELTPEQAALIMRTLGYPEKAQTIEKDYEV
jgi:hypothetical protein